MSGPQQPWWVRPGGAPAPGNPPARPRPNPPAPQANRPPPAPRPQPGRIPQPGRVPHTQPPTLGPPPRRTSRAGRTITLGVAAAVVVLALAGTGVWLLSRSDRGGTRLDVHRAEAGVAQILSDPINGYGANRVATVACNNGENPVVRVGATFTCAVEINDTLRRVNVEFTDADGTYAVDGPR